MKIYKWFFIALFLNVVLSTSLYSQGNPNPNHSGYYNYKKTKGNKQDSGKKYNTAIKINPLLIINGDIPVLIERKIKDNITVEAGLGITFKDFIFNSFYKNPQASQLDLQSVDTRQYPIGYSLSFAAKYYFSVEEPNKVEGSYLSAEVRYRNYKSQALKFDANALSNSISPDDWVNESRELTDIKISYGNIQYISNRFFMEFYSGIGIRLRNIYHAYYSDYTGLTNTVLLHQQDIRPLVSVGIKLGVAL
jgi:hypothetical protein